MNPVRLIYLNQVIQFCYRSTEVIFEDVTFEHWFYFAQNGNSTNHRRGFPRFVKAANTWLSENIIQDNHVLGSGWSIQISKGSSLSQLFANTVPYTIYLYSEIFAGFRKESDALRFRLVMEGLLC